MAINTNAIMNIRNSKQASTNNKQMSREGENKNNNPEQANTLDQVPPPSFSQPFICVNCN